MNPHFAFSRPLRRHLIVAGWAWSSGLTWQRVAALGQISLALAGEPLARAAS